MGNLIINDNTFLRQFEVEIDEDLAKIELRLAKSPKRFPQLK